MDYDDREDGGGCGGCPGNQECCGLRAGEAEELKDGFAELRVHAPVPNQGRGADEEHRERQSEQKHPETEVRASGVPVDDALRCVSRLKLNRLNAPEEESTHKENCGEDEEQFQGGEGTEGGLHAVTLHYKVRDVKENLDSTPNFSWRASDEDG